MSVSAYAAPVGNVEYTGGTDVAAGTTIGSYTLDEAVSMGTTALDASLGSLTAAGNFYPPAYTLSFWVDISALPSSGNITLFTYGGSSPSGDNGSNALVLNSNGTLTFGQGKTNGTSFTFNTGTNRQQTTTTALSTDTVYHIALVNNGGDGAANTATLYINGTAVLDNVTVNLNMAGGSTGTVFSNLSLASASNISYGSAYLYNSALSAGTVQKITENYTITWNGGETGGTWNSTDTNTNWTHDGSDVAFDNSGGDNVKFTSDAAVTVGEAVAVRTLYVTGGTVSFSGSAITAANVSVTGGTLDISTNVFSSGTSYSVSGDGVLTGTITSMDAGTSLTLAGTGASNVTLSANEKAISGNITIGAGSTVTVAKGKAEVFNYDQTGITITLNGGVLDLGDKRQTIGSGTTIVLNGGTIKATDGNTTGDGFGSLDLKGARSINVTASSEISASIRLRGNTTFNVTDGTLTLSGILDPQGDTSKDTDGKIIKTGAGDMIVSGTSSSYNGGFDVNEGKLIVQGANALGSGAVTVNGNGSILDFAVSGGTFTQAQTLTTTGAGKITVSAGTLELAGAVNLSNAIEVADGADLTATGDVLFSLANLTGTTSGNVTTYSLVSLLGESQTLGSDWTGLGVSNVSLAGTSIIGRGATATFNADGTVTAVDGTAGELTWVGDSAGAGTWNYTESNQPWTSSDVATAFVNNDNVTFAKDAAVTVDAAGICVGKMTIASGNTVALTGGNLTVSDSIELGTGATLSLGAGSANGATATLADNSVYAITASAGGAVALDNVSGTGTLKFAGVGNLSDSGGNDSSFSTVSIGSGFTGTVEITAGLVDMLENATATSAILPSRLGNASKVVLNGGGLLFRNVNNTTQSDKGTFTTAIEVGAAGGVIRVYGSGNVTLASDISGSGTLKHTDGGTLTLTGTVNLTGGFTSAKGTTNFTGKTTLGTLTVSNDSSLNATSLLVSAGEATANGTIAAESVTISSTGTTTITNGTIVGNQGVLTISRGGENSSLRGGVTVQDGGTLKLAANDATGWGTGIGNVTIDHGGVLEMAMNSNTSFIGKLTLNGTMKAGTGSGSSTRWDFYSGSSLETTVAGAKIESGVNVFLRRNDVEFAVNGTDASLEIASVIGKNEGNGILKKTGTGTLILSGTNTHLGVTISGGVLVAANASALGASTETATATTTVNSGGVLKVAVDGGVTAGAVTLNEGALFAIDLAAYSNVEEGTALTIIASSAISFNSVSAGNLNSNDIEAYFSVSDSNLASWSSYLREWSYDAGSGLQLTLTIPEPSVFGLLAGLGALALAGSRRRRRKA
ncbi:MAG: beta strand repeat-containing protein [Candidatus Spyradosoma sp.]